MLTSTCLRFLRNSGLAIIAVALYALSLIAGAVILLLVSALLAYLIFPLVQLLQRRLRHSLAIAIAYLLIAGVVAGGMLIVASALIQQSTSLAQSIKFLLSPAGARQIQPVIDFLGKLGITEDAGIHELILDFPTSAIDLTPIHRFAREFVAQ